MDCYTTAMPNVINELDRALLRAHVRKLDHKKLKNLGGIKVLARLLETDLHRGRNEVVKGDSGHSRIQNISTLRAAIASLLTIELEPFCRFLIESISTELVTSILSGLAILYVLLGVQLHGLKHGWMEGASLLAGVLLTGGVTAVTDFWQTHTFKSLANKTRRQRILVSVKREGRIRNVSLSNIVIGDIVQLCAGETVFVNGLFLEGEGLSIREPGSGTLFSPDSKKKLFLYAGSHVEDGYGLMLVTDPAVVPVDEESAVAICEENGTAEEESGLATSSNIESDLTTDEEELSQTSTLQAYATNLAVKLGKIGLVASAIVLIVPAARTSWETQESVSNILHSIMNIVTNFVAMILVGIPEGLPLAATFSLAYATRKIMSSGSILVNRVNAVEKMASVTSICVYIDDKGGKPEIREIKQLAAGGVKVRLVTARDMGSAKAYADVCCITGKVVNTVEFRAWNKAQMREELPNLAILAEAEPADMLPIMKNLQSLGEVVAVMEDCSINELTQGADVSICMHEDETAYKNDSSDIWIRDGSFASTGEIIKRGRALYSNDRKFMRFHLTAWMVILTVNCVGVLTRGNVVLTAEQLIWVHLVMDTLGSVALMTGAPEEDTYAAGPVRPREVNANSNDNSNTNNHTWTSTVWHEVGVQFSVQITILMLLYFGSSICSSSSSQSWPSTTLVFNTLVLSMIFNLVALYQNRICFIRSVPQVAVVVVTLLVQTGLMIISGLSFKHWMLSFTLASVNWPVSKVLRATRPGN